MHTNLRITWLPAGQSINSLISSDYISSFYSTFQPPSSREVEAIRRLGAIACRIYFLDGKSRTLDIGEILKFSFNY